MRPSKSSDGSPPLGATLHPTVLDVSGLRVSYGSAAVLNGVTLTIAPGELVGLAGRNGAGKTTCLRAISGIVPPKAGRLRAGGRELPRDPESILRSGIAHVPEGRRVFASLTVEDNLHAAARGAGQRFDVEQRAMVLELFPPLERLMRRKAGYLSGGEQQMLAISRGLVARPRLLMIDEVSLGLAPRLTGEMWHALGSLPSPDLSLLVVDQNMRILAAHCHRIYLLDDGVATEAVDGPDRVEQLRALYFD